MTEEVMASSSTVGHRARLVATCFGTMSLAAGILANPWLLGKIIGSGGGVSDPADRMIIWVFQAIAITWGLLNLLFRRRTIVAKLNLMMVSLLLVSPLLGEVALRIAIAAKISAVCDAGLYADALSDDDHWKLRHIWSGRQGGDRVVQDSLLGWAPPTSPDNALGAYSPTKYVSPPPDNSILFFGDSFVDSPAGIDHAIPALMDPLLPNRTVFNLGVSGYGVDQIYLRAFRIVEDTPHEATIFGILTSDLDRSILGFRGAPKPQFRMENGTLKLNTLSGPADIDEWVAANPPEIASYLFAFARMRVRLHQPGEFREHNYRRGEKQALNKEILTSAAKLEEKSQRLIFVLFFEPEELKSVGWRESFLLEQMERLGVEFLNTKPLLLEQATVLGENVESFYRADHHLNRRGNEIVAKALASMLDKTHSPEISGSPPDSPQQGIQ